MVAGVVRAASEVLPEAVRRDGVPVEDAATRGTDLHRLPPNAASTSVGIPTVLDKTKSDRGKSVHRTEYLTFIWGVKITDNIQLSNNYCCVLSLCEAII